MDRREFYGQVLRSMHRLTRREEEAVRQELEGHLEDHICALLELGYDEALAEERTVAAMGDPTEIGRAMDRQYPPFWLAAKRVVMALTLMAVLLVGMPLCQTLDNTADNLRARFCPEKLAAVRDFNDQLGAVEELDLQVECGDVTVRVYQVGLENPTGGGMAYLAISAWDRRFFAEQVPGDAAAALLWNRLELVTSSGMKPVGGQGWKWAYIYEIPVNYGDSVQMTYDRYGKKFDLTVELPSEVRGE